MTDSFQSQTWRRDECAVFFRTKERHGGLSNMAAGFPICINRTVWLRTSEALYQAMRFPKHPDIQHEIIDQKSPMAAKMVAKREVDHTRPDWMAVRVDMMRWAIAVKLLNNPVSFGAVLKETAGLPIVEQSRKDQFWGAVAMGDQELYGQNVLGRLLVELRDMSADKLRNSATVPRDDMLLFCSQITQVS